MKKEKPHIVAVFRAGESERGYRKDCVSVMHASPYQPRDLISAAKYGADELAKAQKYGAEEAMALAAAKVRAADLIGLRWTTSIVRFRFQRHFVYAGDPSATWAGEVGTWSHHYGMHIEVGDESAEGIHRASAFITRMQKACEKMRETDPETAISLSSNGMDPAGILAILRKMGIHLFARVPNTPEWMDAAIAIPVPPEARSCWGESWHRDVVFGPWLTSDERCRIWRELNPPAPETDDADVTSEGHAVA